LIHDADARVSFAGLRFLESWRVFLGAMINIECDDGLVFGCEFVAVFGFLSGEDVARFSDFGCQRSRLAFSSCVKKKSML